MEKRRKVNKEEVIAKLKDDGDFDNLRLKIIRKIKDNEDLRDQIISTIRQSTALNRAGAEKLKPRQLSDAIFDEVGNNLMSQISDGLWETIRSANGMKNEIAETVQSVYNKMVEPEKKEDSRNIVDAEMLPNGVDGRGTDKATANGGVLSAGDQPPGFSLTVNHQNNSYKHEDRLQVAVPNDGHVHEHNEKPNVSRDVIETTDHYVPPGFSGEALNTQPDDASDEDPDVPPGFG